LRNALVLQFDSVLSLSPTQLPAIEVHELF